MGALRLAAFAFAFIIGTPARADPVAQWRGHIEEASERFGIPVDWIERVMRAESGGRTTYRGAPVTSSAGAMGLMQLMPGTWKDMRSRLGLGNDPHHPRDNILAGTFYLRLMYERFGHPGMFAAYNAGPARYAAYLEGRGGLPGETVAYLKKVAGEPALPAVDIRSVSQARITDTRLMPLENAGRAEEIFFIKRPHP